jgi:hypothetical protein
VPAVGQIAIRTKEGLPRLGKVWYPLVLEKQNTPCAGHAATLLRGPGFPFGTDLVPAAPGFTGARTEAARIPEPIMIALEAMEQSNSAWVIDQDMFQPIVDGKDKDVPKGLLAAAREKHIEEFSSSTTSQWTCLPGYREPFLKIWPRLSSEEQAEEQPMTAAS